MTPKELLHALVALQRAGGDPFIVRVDDGWISASEQLPKAGDSVWILLADSPDASTGTKMGTAVLKNSVEYPWIIPVDGKDWYVQLWRRTRENDPVE